MPSRWLWPGLALAGLASGAAQAAERIPWSVDSEAVFRQAQERERPVLVLFTGDPCPRPGPQGPAGETRTGGRTEGAPGRLGELPEYETDCARLETDVLLKADVVAEAGRFLPLVMNRTGHAFSGETPAERDVYRRYEAGTVPTLLVTDPWGNEIVRLIGATPKDLALRVLRAVPQDFKALRAAGLALRQDPQSPAALLAVASFYAGSGLAPFAERYYVRAAALPEDSLDATGRAQLAVGHGLNLLKLGRGKEAAAVFEAQAKRHPEGPQADGVLFGWAMAALTLGDTKQATSLADELGRRFPDSAYTARLRENLARR
jgi:Tfp pilus assembly protein PilF